MSDNRKDLPAVGSPNFLQRVREMLMTYTGSQGDLLDRGVTLRDLTGAGLIDLSKTYQSTRRGSPIAGPGPNAGDGYTLDQTPPPTPTGFMVSAAISHLFIGCDPQTYTQGHGHMATRVYGATWITGPLPVFADAVLITEFGGTTFSHPTNPATTWHLWITWVTRDGEESPVPAGGTNGLVAKTGQDVAKLVEALTGPGNPFKVITTPITLPDGTPVPAGTYMSDAFMGSFVAKRGQIGLLAVDDARIASLSVTKLTAGSLAVGQYVESTSYIPGWAGWRINADGTAEFSAVVVRGTVYASAGQIGGVTIAANSLYTAPYATAGGFYFGSNGWASLGSKLTWDGYNLNIDGGGRFSGVLSAATGSFSGALIAATGTFSGSLQAASGTFYGGGSFSGNLSANTLSTNGGRFTAYSDGSVIMDRADIRRRDAIATGSASAYGQAFTQTKAGDSSDYWEFNKQVISVVIDTGVDSWDSINFGINQPLHAIVSVNTSYKHGGDGTPGAYICRFATAARPITSTHHYVTGGAPNSATPRIYILAEIRLADAVASAYKIEVWGLSWSLFKA